MRRTWMSILDPDALANVCTLTVAPQPEFLVWSRNLPTIQELSRTTRSAVSMIFKDTFR